MHKKILNFFTLMLLTTGCAEATPEIKGTVLIAPAKGGDPQKIIPGSPVILKVQVRNAGSLPSPESALFIRYAYPAPLDQQTGSVLYTSETEPVPVLAPGESAVVSFSTPHQLPTLYEFIRNDWSMRKYEAVLTQNDKQVVIADLPLTFSAYYYSGPSTK